MDPYNIDSSDPYSGTDGYGEHNTPLHLIQTPEDAGKPSNKYGNKLIAPIFVGFVVLSIGFTYVMYRWNKWCMWNRAQRIQAQEGQFQKQKEQYLVHGNKPEASPSASANEDTSISTKHNEMAHVDAEVGVEMAPMPPCENGTGHTEALCQLCNRSLNMPQAEKSDGGFYESNNPICKHCFHKNCIDKWLDFENICPICNQPFLVVPTSGRNL